MTEAWKSSSILNAIIYGYIGASYLSVLILLGPKQKDKKQHKIRLEERWNSTSIGVRYYTAFILTNIDLTCAQAEQIKTKHFGMTIKWKSTSTDIRFYTKFMWFYT